MVIDHFFKVMTLGVLPCSRQPHLWPKLTGFQNWFRLLWNACVPLRLHAGYFEPTVIMQTGFVSCVERD